MVTLSQKFYLKGKTAMAAMGLFIMLAVTSLYLFGLFKEETDWCPHSKKIW